MTKKTSALLQAIGMFLLVNVVGFGAGFIARWLGMKPGVDFRVMPRLPGGFYTIEILMLIIAFLFYRSQVRRE